MIPLCAENTSRSDHLSPHNHELFRQRSYSGIAGVRSDIFKDWPALVFAKCPRIRYMILNGNGGD